MMMGMMGGMGGGFGGPGAAAGGLGGGFGAAKGLTVSTDSIIATLSPEHNRILAYSAETGSGRAYRAPRDTKVAPVTSGGVLAVQADGPKVTELAAYDPKNGTWYKVELKEPAQGKVDPLLGGNLVAYSVGNRAYAFSAVADRWDVLELEKDAVATPVVSNRFIAVEHDGRLYVFSAKTGQWSEVDPKTDT
jgi:hypothetical protein